MAELPTVPAAQNVAISPFQMPFQPMSSAEYLQLNQQLFKQQLSQQSQALTWLGQNTPRILEGQLYFSEEYAPQYMELFQGQLEEAAPEYLAAYRGLSENIQEGLEAGYDLGPSLTREIEQQIRAGQTARGNWLGTAPTAQEAFGTGQASIDLYNQRMAQAAGFAELRTPMEMWGGLAGIQPMSQLAPFLGYMGAQQGAASSQASNVFGTIANSRSNYNATAAGAYGSYVGGLVGAAQVNNQSAFDRYSAQFDQFLYKQSVQQGLFSQPSAAGGGGMGGFGTAAIGAVGAAAAGAAAAICWVARLVIPDRWREFRRFLFTKAPRDFRQKYVTYGRRYSEELGRSADTLSKQRDIERIRRAMLRCLQS